MEERAFRESIHRMVNDEGRVHLTTEGVAQRLGLTPDEAEQRLDELVTRGELELDSDDHGNLFYFSPDVDRGGVFAGQLDAKINENAQGPAPGSPRRDAPLPSESAQPHRGYYPPPPAGYGAPPQGFGPPPPGYGAPPQPVHPSRQGQPPPPWGAQHPGYGQRPMQQPRMPQPPAGWGPYGPPPQGGGSQTRPQHAPYYGAQQQPQGLWEPGQPHPHYPAPGQHYAPQQPGPEQAWYGHPWDDPRAQQTMPVPYQDQFPAGYQPYDPERRSPTAALLLSFFPGAGQLYNGEIGKAFFFFFLTTFLYSLFPFSFLGLIPHAISAADAHATARRSNYGMLPP